MARPLADGVYEHVITEALATALAALDADRHVDRAPLDEGEGPLRLTRHVATELERSLRSFTGPDAATERLSLANDILELLRTRAAGSPGQSVPAPPELLTAVYGLTPPPRPWTPLAVTTLLTRNRAEPALGHELAAEIASADRIDALVSFVTVSGWRQLRPALGAFSLAGRPFRLITTTYTGATQAEAVQQMALLPGSRVKVSYDGRRTRLHAKAWLFHRDTGLSTAYIGSANLSAPPSSAGTSGW